MEGSMGAKKVAILYILKLLERDSDADHMLTHEVIIDKLDREYGIVLERKAVARNLALLAEAGYDIVTTPRGSYLTARPFEDSELRLLIDGVLSDRFIPARYSTDLIKKLCALGNRYFRSHKEYIYTADDWNKSENLDVFYHVELIDEAIRRGRQLEFDYNRYGADKKLHFTAHHLVSPYQLLLKNRNYYLMALNEKYNGMVYYRLDRITSLKETEKCATPIERVAGYEKGIDYNRISSSLPYMFADAPIAVEFLCEEWVLDHLVDWFGKKEIRISKCEDRYKVRVTVSENAMEYWALQYVNGVEILSPVSLRDKIKADLKNATEKYK